MSLHDFSSRLLISLHDFSSKGISTFSFEKQTSEHRSYSLDIYPVAASEVLQDPQNSTLESEVQQRGRCWTFSKRTFFKVCFEKLMPIKHFKQFQLMFWKHPFRQNKNPLTDFCSMETDCNKSLTFCWNPLSKRWSELYSCTTAFGRNYRTRVKK